MRPCCIQIPSAPTLPHCSHQVSNRWVPPFGVVCFLLAMAFPDDFANGFVPRSPVSPFGLELENIHEDHGVSWQVVDEMLALELETYRRCFPAQQAISALQRYNRCKCAFLQRDLAASWCALLPATSGSASQGVDRDRERESRCRHGHQRYPSPRSRSLHSHQAAL